MNISVYVSIVFGEVLTFSLFLVQLLGVFRVLAERTGERNTLEFVFEFVFAVCNCHNCKFINELNKLQLK